jgi:hypothetical protein
MSWITDLAGKAEGLLNQLDQTTGDALTKHGSPQRASRSSSQRSMQPELMSVVSESPSLPPQTTSRPAFDRRDRSSGYASSVSSQVSRTTGRTAPAQDEDNKLLALLNENEVLSVGSRSRKSSTSSMHSLPKHMFQTSVSSTNTITTQSTKQNNLDSPPIVVQHAAAPITADYDFSTVNERQRDERKAQEQDLARAVQAKDAQLAVLRVQLQEAQQLLAHQTHQSDQLTTERNRLLRATSESSEVRNEAVGSLQTQLNDAEQSLGRERDRAQQLHTEALSKSERIENDMLNLNRLLTDCQKSLTEEKLRAKEIDAQLRLAKYNLEANKNEFDDYKSKAQKILQSKEKIIESLKFGSSSSTDAGERAGGFDNEHTQLAVELEECRADRDLLNEDLQQLHVQLGNARTELHDVETSTAQEQRDAVQAQRSLQEQCQNYQLNAAQYREQLEHLKQEYQYTQDELRRQHTQVHSKLQDKDAHIATLMQQVASRQLHSNTDNDLEQRIRQLTENLIYKQTSIETLHTEKNSLQLQLERTQVAMFIVSACSQM